MAEYVELHAHSNFSFQEGASSVEELVARAVELGYPALALTDHDNLCGAMRFARKAKRAGLRPITGAEVTVAAARNDDEPARTKHRRSEAASGKASGSRARHELAEGASPWHLTLLATSPTGYANLCNLLSFSHYFSDRRSPELDPRLLPEHAQGLVLLTACARGEVPSLLTQGHTNEAKERLKQ